MSEIPNRLVITDRRTRTLVGTGVSIEPSDWPFDVAEPDLGLFRYLDWFKFEDLVANRRLYFRRLDRLDDQMEGRFSEGNKKFQTALWKRFQEAYSIAHDHGLEVKINEGIRYRVFINCWNARQNEDARMWKEYTRTNDAVAIRSTCRLVDSSIEPGAYQPVCVRYVNAGEPRPEFHSLAPFVFKGVCYAFESEVRFLLVDTSSTIYLDQEADFFRTVSARPTAMILSVITHPRATKRFRQKVARFCSRYLRGVTVRSSQLSKTAVC